MLTDDCKNRLENYKFRQARSEITAEATEHERDVIEALSDMLGNCGWLSERSSLDTLVAALVRTLCEGTLPDYQDEEMPHVEVFGPIRGTMTAAFREVLPGTGDEED